MVRPERIIKLHQGRILPFWTSAGRVIAICPEDCGKCSDRFVCFTVATKIYKMTLTEYRKNRTVDYLKGTENGV